MLVEIAKLLRKLLPTETYQVMYYEGDGYLNTTGSTALDEFGVDRLWIYRNQTLLCTIIDCGLNVLVNINETFCLADPNFSLEELAKKIENLKGPSVVYLLLPK